MLCRLNCRHGALETVLGGYSNGLDKVIVVSVVRNRKGLIRYTFITNVHHVTVEGLSNLYVSLILDFGDMGASVLQSFYKSDYKFQILVIEETLNC